MSYYTHFYTFDKNKQVEWATEILKSYQKRLKNVLENIPDDDSFKRMHEYNLDELTDEKYQEFKENSVKYHWKQDFIDELEDWYRKYRRPDYTWEDDKREWIGKLIDLKNTGLLTVFEDVSPAELPDYLIDLYHVFKNSLLDYGDPYSDEIREGKPYSYEIREGKIFSGEVFKRYYRVKGRYCESMWFNDDGIIDMIEDYVDVTKKTKTGRNSKLKLTKEEKQEIHEWFDGHDECYCWVV